jgi:hypothetical protein
MLREIFGPPGLKTGRNDTRIEYAVPQPKGGGVATRLPGYETVTKQMAVGRELALDDCHPMDPVIFAETRPATVIIVPPNCVPGLHPVVCSTSAREFDLNFPCLVLRRSFLLPTDKQKLFSSAMSVKRDLVLKSPGTSERLI